MPNYTFRDKRTGRVIEKNLPMDQRDDVPAHLERLIVPPRVAYVRNLDNPISPEVRVPIAFKQLESKKGYREICRKTGFSVDHLRRVWQFCAALVCLLTMSAGAADINKGYSWTPTDRVTSTKLNNAIDLATIDTTFVTGKSPAQPVTADSLLFYSQAAGDYKKTTLSALLLANTNLIVGQTEDTSPATNDFLLSYDTSAAGFKKLALATLRALTYRTEVITNKALGTAYNLNHSLGATPQIVRCVIVCTNVAGSSGYSPNDEVPVEALQLATGGSALYTCYANYSGGIGNVKLNISSAALKIMNPSGGSTSLTALDWNAKVYLYYFPP